MEKLPPITEMEWEKVNEFNRFIFQDFLDNSAELSPKTIKAYASNLKIWFVWVKNFLQNKKHTDIKSLDFKKYQNWLSNRDCSSSDIYNKRSAVSSLNNYLETYYAEDYPTFRNFINKSIKRPVKAFVNEKKPLTKEEFANLISELEKQKEWQKIAYLRFTLESAARRGESVQILKNIVETPVIVKSTKTKDENGIEAEAEVRFYQTPPMRCKGSGKKGKIRKLMFGQETMDAFKKWLEERGEDDCPFMFVTKYGHQIKQVSPSCFNGWSKNTFEKIVGRRFHPHLLRESRATQAKLEDGKSLDAICSLLGHNSVDTTKIYIIRDSSDDADELFI